LCLTPPVLEATEATADATAVTTSTEANDIVMAEDDAQSKAPEATEAIQPSTTDVAAPTPVPHTMEKAFYCGELISFKWPIMTPPAAPGPQY
jgi:hypothetical protein